MLKEFGICTDLHTRVKSIQAVVRGKAEWHLIPRARASLNLRPPAAACRCCQGYEIWDIRELLCVWYFPRVAMNRPLWCAIRPPPAAVPATAYQTLIGNGAVRERGRATRPGWASIRIAMIWPSVGSTAAAKVISREMSVRQWATVFSDPPDTPFTRTASHNFYYQKTSLLRCCWSSYL
jgi:hypothetical protein